jgi:hypothetical protein
MEIASLFLFVEFKYVCVYTSDPVENKALTSSDDNYNRVCKFHAHIRVNIICYKFWRKVLQNILILNHRKYTVLVLPVICNFVRRETLESKEI